MMNLRKVSYCILLRIKLVITISMSIRENNNYLRHTMMRLYKLSDSEYFKGLHDCIFSKNLMWKPINKKFKPVEAKDDFRFQAIIDYYFKLKSFTNLMRKIKEKAIIVLPLHTTLEKLILHSLLGSKIKD